MIKFFREIRKKILFEKNVRTYLKYALGEILLVMIGILLAFQVNNWKQDLDNRGEEMRILSGLKQEFEVNLAEVSRNIELNTSSVQSSIDLIDLLRSENPFDDNRLLDSLFYEVYMFGSFDAQTGLIDEVISSGKLSIIKNTELRDRLTSFTGLLDNAEEDYVLRVNYYMDHITPYLSRYFPLANKDRYMDFSSWSDTYRSIKLSESPFEPKYNEIDLLHLENLIVIHKLNNDFVNLNEAALKEFFIKTLEIINKNLNPKNLSYK